MSEIEQKAIKGVKWTTVERIATLVLQFVIGIIVARLVAPSDYGLISMLAIFTSLSMVFINSGFSIALIRNKENTPLDYSTIFFFNVGLGVLLYIILFLSAPLIADFYDIPLLEKVTRVYSLILVLNSVLMVPIAKLTRDMEYEKQFIIGIVALVISGIVGITMAYKGYGVWALVAQGLAYSLVQIILVFTFVKWHPIIAFSITSLKKMFSFGSKMLATNVIDMIYDNIYTLVIGKFYSPSDVGFYNRSFHLSIMPQNILLQILNKVVLPILSPYQDNDKKLLEIYERMYRMSVFVMYPTMVLLAVLAEPIVLILLGEKWLPSVPYLQILSFGVIFVTLTLVNLNLFFVKGRSDVILKIDIIKKIWGFIVVAVMVPLGMKWICIGTIIYALIAFLINCNQTKRILGYGLKSQVKTAFPPFFYSLCMGACVYVIIEMFDNPFAQVAIGCLVGVLSYIIISRIFKEPALVELLKAIKHGK